MLHPESTEALAPHANAIGDRLDGRIVGVSL